MLCSVIKAWCASSWTQNVSHDLEAAPQCSSARPLRYQQRVTTPTPLSSLLKQPPSTPQLSTQLQPRHWRHTPCHAGMERFLLPPMFQKMEDFNKISGIPQPLSQDLKFLCNSYLLWEAFLDLADDATPSCLHVSLHVSFTFLLPNHCRLSLICSMLIFPVGQGKVP